VPDLPKIARSSVCALPDFVLQRFDHNCAEFDHRQLYRILQAGIRQALLPAGLKLPPTRNLAQALGIARNTVVHVYEQLTLEGSVTSGVGRGTYVADVKPPDVPQRHRPGEGLRPSRQSVLSRRGGQLVAHAGASQHQWGAFTPGVPEVRMFPAQIWSRLQSRIWRDLEPQSLSYATNAGDVGLRRALAEHLQGTRGVNCTPEQIVITSGTQQSLQLVARMLADPGDTVWLEDPGYWGAQSVFRALGLHLVPVGLDAEGLAPSPDLWSAPPRLIFASPSHQYPTGVVMSHRRRRELLDFAAQHEAWVIEDDYDSEFRYGARPLPTLQGLDQHNRVIYLGTFSKTLFPALRLAYIVLPSDLVHGFSCALSELYREGQTPQQAVLARFLSEGHYATHIRRMRAVYSARHDALLQAIGQHFGNALPVIGGAAGLHLVLGLPESVDDVAVARQVLRAGVMSRPLSAYHLQQPAPAKGLLLGYGAVEEKAIVPNFALLAAATERFL
jgi:GntR family transcriptional regulator/MocR family aminotransferase